MKKMFFRTFCGLRYFWEIHTFAPGAPVKREVIKLRFADRTRESHPSAVLTELPNAVTRSRQEYHYFFWLSSPSR